MSTLKERLKSTKAASVEMMTLKTSQKDNALREMADALEACSDEVLSANRLDIEDYLKVGGKGAFLDRLTLNKKRVMDMAEGIRAVANLPDPVGETLSMWKRPNGIEIGQKRVPIGVIGIIYEARPNVTADAIALCLKSGNAVVLRGGSEAVRSNKAISEILSKAAYRANIPRDAIYFIDDTRRETALEFMQLDGILDLLIPRGGAGLIKTVVQNSRVPVIETGVGNCHIFVDSSADLEMAKHIIMNAKTQRPGVCNAVETVLVHRQIARVFLPQMLELLIKAGVEIRACEQTLQIFSDCQKATEEDWVTEFSDLILAVKVVEDSEEAINHINRYGTKHSEAIITTDYFKARKFQDKVDAAAVYVNASTRFTDGFEFGFGAEIGISTQKMHARGPMGLKELTTTKYLIFGEGQVRK